MTPEKKKEVEKDFEQNDCTKSSVQKLFEIEKIEKRVTQFNP